MKYSSLERVKMILQHREADKVPLDIGSSAITGINIKTLGRLRKLLGLSCNSLKIYNEVTQLGVVDNDLIDVLHIDVKGVDPNYISSCYSRTKWTDGDNYRLYDDLGIGWRMPAKGGHYFDIFYNPLSQCETVDDLERFEWPDISTPLRYAGMKKSAHQITENDKAYVIGRHFAGMWETAMWMTGYEKFLYDMIMNKKLVFAIMDKILENKMGYWEKALETVGDSALIISEADDLGTQNGLICSLDLYREMIYPYHKKLFQFIKEKAKTKVYIFFHCDGSCKEAIPLLIDAGIDILNPVQVNCSGMDTKTLKKEFGRDLTFWGAICDSQRVLPFCNQDEVREETKRRIDDCMPGGGWVAAPIHNIQSDVPAENIIAMWEVLEKYGCYT